MSTRVDQFCETLRTRLNAMETRVETFKSRIDAIPGKAEAELRQAHVDALRRVDAGKQSVGRLRAKLKAGADQRLAETKQVVNEWRANREVQKLTARADRAEVMAALAIDFAAAAIEEADEAILEAVLARIDADAACTR